MVRDVHKVRTVDFPGLSFPEDLKFTEVRKYTRSHFFTPVELMRLVVGKPLAVMQANIRHRSQITPFIRAFVDSKASALILAVSEDVQRDFGVCIEEATYFAARTLDEENESKRSNGLQKRVAFLFDHALTYEAAERALEAGVSGIMYDPSDGGRRTISIEENILLSKRYVELSKKYKTSIELEIGKIPGMKGAVDMEFTDPSAVATLVKTYPDAAVAVSVGNEHYKLTSKGRGLQLDLFKRIREAVPLTPLVLHGGTGVSDAELRSSIEGLLLDKLNVGTEFIRETLFAIAKVRAMKQPTENQLRDMAFCKELLFHLDAYPQIYLEEAQKAVYRKTMAKLIFLTG